ncbi:hypothetical protein Cni_G28959 [Canna indica]|uniref:Uncharacterized protein n=1 Tax=Canna indica TaxID=4628 RepID=A0AAQ3L3F6_9LILI|nr:hypothetical protein Cni_G28959 [Canna indica]
MGASLFPKNQWPMIQQKGKKMQMHPILAISFSCPSTYSLNKNADVQEFKPLYIFKQVVVAYGVETLKVIDLLEFLGKIWQEFTQLESLYGGTMGTLTAASSRSAILGEVILNLADQLTKEDCGPLFLPLKKCNYGEKD